MKKLILSALLFLTVATASALPPLQAERIATETMIAAARSTQAWPDADLLLVEDQTFIRYEADGTYAYTSDMAYKILTEKGRQEKSNVGIGYNTDYGTARFVKAEVVKPDGHVIPVDLAAQSREAVNQGQMAANIYDPSQKELKLTIPDLGIGDVLRYTVAGEQTKTVVPDTWSDLFTLEETFPVLHAVYEVDAPAELPLTRIELKDEIPGTVTGRTEQRGDRIIYTWEAKNVPRRFEEPDMPAAYTVSQRLLLSTIPDWETLSKWYWTLSQPQLAKVNDAMKAKVAELTAGLTDRQQKIESIFRFVSQDIRYMGITVEDEAPGYEPHDVSLTFDNRYGVCRDKAALLVSMLRLAGFDAYPVLIYVGPKKDPEVPQPWFNHAITAVRNEDGSWQLMDATNENTRDLLPGYLSHRSYLVATPQGEPLQTSPVVPPEENLLSIHVDAALDAESRITGTAVLSFGGINDTAYRGRLAALQPDERMPYFEERLKQAFGAAKLTRLEIQPEQVRDTSVPLSVQMDFQIDDALAAGKNAAVLQVPTLINHFGLFGRLIGPGIGLDKRRFPLLLDFTCGVSETVRLDLRRSGLRPAALPEYETIDTPDLFINRSITATNDLLISRADILLRTVEFSPEQYLTLKQNLKASERNARKRVILEREGFPGADFATLSETVEYTLLDAHNWKEDRTVRRKVLTYAGKRQLSDLKFTYNPAMQQTFLAGAAVTAPDGSVKNVDPDKEINIMDAPWAGDAPRYPAEKTMVVSLPGVEVGSVIEYRIVNIFRDMPFFSAAEYFADFNPLLSKTVRVLTPRKMNVTADTSKPSSLRYSTLELGANAGQEWSCANQPMTKKENSLPPGWIISPSVMLSCGSPQEYAAQIEKVLLRAAKPDKVVKAKARGLIAGLKSRTEKIAALRDFTDRTIRAAGPGFASLPLSAITPAPQVLAEGYGNTTDRAVLLYALLDAAGLKPRFLLASSLPAAEGVGDQAIHALQRNLFDTVLVAATGDKKQTIYLGDSGQYAEPGTLAHTGRPAIDLKTGNVETPQAMLPDGTGTTFDITLDENGNAALTCQKEFTGTEFEKFHKQFAQFTPEEQKRAYQGLLAGLSQSAEAAGDLQTSFDYPGTLQLSARLPAYATRDGDRMYFTLPEDLSGLLNLQSSSRENPFYIEKPEHRALSYSITLPKGWKPVLAPESFHTELPDGGGFVNTYASAGSGRLNIRMEAQLNPAVIQPDDYDRLLELNNRLTAPAARTILLQKK